MTKEERQERAALLKDLRKDFELEQRVHDQDIRNAQQKRMNDADFAKKKGAMQANAQKDQKYWAKEMAKEKKRQQKEEKVKAK